MKYGELKLSQVEAMVNKLGGMAGVQRLLADELTLIESKSPAKPAPKSADLLTPLDQVITVPSSAEPFVARDHFKVDTGSNAELPISCMWDNFQEQFLSKTEQPSAETNLRSRCLNQASTDGPILQALGGNTKAETTLREMHHYLKSADRIKWHIFYITGVDNTLWAVCAFWLDDGWYLYANSVESPPRWYDGYLVTARDS